MEVSGQLHAPAAVSPGKNPGTYWVGGWVDPSAGLDVFGRTEESFAVTGLWTTYRSTLSLFYVPATLFRLPVIFFGCNKKVRIKLSVCPDKHHTLKARKQWRYSFTNFFYLVCVWRRVAYFTPRPPYPRGMSSCA